jgi:hypothetical protein
LPSISSKPKGGEAVVEDQAHVQADVDANFRETVTRAMTRIETKEVREKPTMDDENKTFRTRLVAMWMVTNAGLAFAMESVSGVSGTTSQLQSRQSTYFAIILYSTFALSAVRFIGVCFLSYKFNVGITKKTQFSVYTTSSPETCFDASGRTSRSSSIMIERNCPGHCLSLYICLVIHSLYVQFLISFIIGAARVGIKGVLLLLDCFRRVI